MQSIQLILKVVHVGDMFLLLVLQGPAQIKVWFRVIWINRLLVHKNRVFIFAQIGMSAIVLSVNRWIISIQGSEKQMKEV